MEWWWKWKPKNLVVAQTSQLPWDSTTTGSINIHLHEIENWCCCDPRQPIDKGINKQFKTKIRTQHQEWMVNGQFIFPTISQGGKWSPSKELVLQWINWAWKETKTELVAQSFKSYSILKALNGTKDKAIRGEETGNWGKNRNNDFVDNQFQTEGTRRDAESMFTNVLLIPYTLTSACLFSISFSKNFLWCLQREFVQQLRASWVCNPFL